MKTSENDSAPLRLPTSFARAVFDGTGAFCELAFTLLQTGLDLETPEKRPKWLPK